MHCIVTLFLPSYPSDNPAQGNRTCSTWSLGCETGSSVADRIAELFADELELVIDASVQGQERPQDQCVELLAIGSQFGANGR